MSAMSSSKPAGVSERAISSTASDCLGANRILVAMAIAPREGWYGEARLAAVHAGGVALAGDVLDQAGVARTEQVLRAVAQPDLELAREDDHELAPGRGMPVDEVADRALAERDLGGREPLGPGRRAGEIDRFDVGLAVAAGVEPECLHDGLSRCRLVEWARGLYHPVRGARGPMDSTSLRRDLLTRSSCADYGS